MRILRPSSLSRTLALATPAVGLAVQRADAAFDTFIKFDNINGEAIDKLHQSWCQALSFSFGFDNPAIIGGTGSGSSGHPTAKPIFIHKLIDKASPQLFLRSAMGEPLPTVTLEVAKVASTTAPVVFYKIVLTNAFVTSVSTTGNAGSDVAPTETIELSYEKISIIYSVMDPKGGVTPQPEVTWNFAENTK